VEEEAKKTVVARFAIQFDPAEIRPLAARYCYPGEAQLISDVVKPARARGWFTAREFTRLVDWKTGGRAVPLVTQNSPTAIVRATRTALSRLTPDEERIGALLRLRGVGFPVASTVLHFGHRTRYPVLDVRALEALGYVRAHANYSFGLWWDYVTTCRALAHEFHVSMRTLDRALWQWSKERGT
jgi:hypothetical protein